MDTEHLFKDKRDWQKGVKRLGSSVVYEIDCTHNLVISNDCLSWVEKRESKTLEIPGIGEILHAILVTYLSKNERLAAESGIIFGAKQIKEFLGKMNYADAHNPALWRRTIIRRNSGPVYSLESFSLLGITSSLEYEVVKFWANGGFVSKIQDYFLEKYIVSSGHSSYREFLNSPLMTST